MSPEEFRRQGHALIDLIADYRAGVASRRVTHEAKPGDLRRALPASPPDAPSGSEDIFGDLFPKLLPHLTHWQHPSFFGYFPSNALLSSVLGDFLSTGLGVIGLSWQACPALTELEEVVCDWARQMLGLPPSFSGVIQDTASTSTLVALLCAREKSSDFSLASTGIQGRSSPLVVYISEHCHSSVEKAALLAGFGRDNLRAVGTDDAFAMRPDLLAAAVAADRRAGKTPCAVVACTGTTTTTAMDPIADIAGITARERLWLHVDAAMAGSAMILPECRHLWHGVEAADSVVVNAHKWLGAVFDTSLYFVRDPEALVRVMSTNPSYLKTEADGSATNYRDWGIPLGRRFRALKLWGLLQSEGVSGLQARLRRDIANARRFAVQVRENPPWRVLAPVPIQTVCVRHEPPGLAGEALDRHTLAWVNRVNASGEAYLTPAVLQGRWMARVSIGGEQTEWGHVEKLWALMRASAS